MLKTFAFLLILMSYPVFAGEDTLSVEMLEKAKSQRAFGNPDAKVIVREYSSLSCGHCANFHAEVLPKIKKEFSDKILFIFHDMPTSASALDAAMLSRCIDKSKYNEFTKDLFETQGEWAFNENWLKHLSNKANDYGLSNDEVKACVASKDLQEFIIKGAQDASSNWGINSTPNFVIADEVVIRTNVPFKALKKEIDKAIEAAK